MRRPTCYVAGPYSAQDALGRAYNTRCALWVAEQLFQWGALPMVPHSQWHPLYGRVDEALVIEAGLRLLEQCDALVLLPGWERSQGTLGELRHSQTHLVQPVFEWQTEQEELRAWLSNG